MLDLVELGEAGVRALGFWLWILGPKYRAQVLDEWRTAGTGHRVALGVEYLISAVLGLGIVVLVWILLT